MNCTNCGAQNLDGAKFCAGCGAPLATAEQPAYQQPAYQPQQPYGYAPNQQPQQPYGYAPNQQPQQPYGYAPNQQPQQPYGYAPYPQQPQKPKKPINWMLIGIIAGVVAVALILFLVLGGSSNSPEGVAEAFMEAAADSDVATVRDLLYGDMKEDAYDYCAASEMDMAGLEISMKDFEVVSTDEITDKDELESIAYRYDIDAEIEEAQELIAEVTMEFSYSGESRKMTNDAEFLLICIDGDWYVADMG